MKTMVSLCLMATSLMTRVTVMILVVGTSRLLEKT